MSPKVWYTDKPLGINKLREIIKNLMKSAGVDGHYTNHSLRVTAATRMFASGVDEQVIKERTGHKSEAVRAYKHTDEGLLRAAEMATVGDNSGDLARAEWSRKLKDLDGVKLGEGTVSYRVKSDSSNDCHKSYCIMKDDLGNCPQICEILKVIDSKKKSPKRLKLSLKVRKN